MSTLITAKSTKDSLQPLKAVKADPVPAFGETMSPNYPEKYLDNLNMVEYMESKIVVAGGKRGELTIIDFGD